MQHTIEASKVNIPGHRNARRVKYNAINRDLDALRAEAHSDSFRKTSVVERTAPGWDIEAEFSLEPTVVPWSQVQPPAPPLPELEWWQLSNAEPVEQMKKVLGQVVND